MEMVISNHFLFKDLVHHPNWNNHVWKMLGLPGVYTPDSTRRGRPPIFQPQIRLRRASNQAWKRGNFGGKCEDVPTKLGKDGWNGSKCFLVDGFNPSEKNCQIGSFLPSRVENEKIFEVPPPSLQLPLRISKDKRSSKKKGWLTLFFFKRGVFFWICSPHQWLEIPWVFGWWYFEVVLVLFLLLYPVLTEKKQVKHENNKSSSSFRVKVYPKKKCFIAALLS